MDKKKNPVEDKKKPEVWMIHPYGITPEYPASTRTYEFARELANRGYNVTCWFSSFIHPLKQYREGCRGRLMLLEKIDNFMIRWIWTSPYRSNDSRRSLNMVSFFLVMLFKGLLTKSPDVIIGSSPHPFGALAGALLSRIKGSKFILEVRDLWPDSLVDMQGVPPGPVVRLLYIIERYLYKVSDHIIVLTEGIKTGLLNKGISPDKISFLPNGVALHQDKRQPTVRISKKDLGLEGKFVCMYAGAVAPANALETVVLAAEKLSGYQDIAFVIIGEGQEKAGLEKLVLDRGLKNIRFLGAVPKKDINSYLEQADVFILTLKKARVFEGALPNKIFDYLYNNRPVICAVDGEVRKFVEDNGTGVFVPPEDSDAMACRILELFNDNTLVERLSQNGRRTVTGKFARERLCDRLEEIILNTQAQ